MIHANGSALNPYAQHLLTSGCWPKKPYCSNDKQARFIRKLDRAITFSHIQPNPPDLCAWLVFDLDREGAAFAWEDAGLPQPTWIAINPQNGHAHLCWGLKTPVRMAGEHVREAPIRYLNAIKRAFCKALGADEHYAGLMTKNPFHPDWKIIWGSRPLYEMEYLAEHVELSSERKANAASALQDGHETGRNVLIFNEVRHWAYHHIKQYRKQSFEVWQDVIHSQIEKRNAALPSPLPHNELRHIGRSISRWVWRKDAQAYQKFCLTQRTRAAKAVKARQKARQPREEAARTFWQQGCTAKQLAARFEISRSTAYRWIKKFSHDPKSDNSAVASSFKDQSAAGQEVSSEVQCHLEAVQSTLFVYNVSSKRQSKHFFKTARIMSLAQESLNAMRSLKPEGAEALSVLPEEALSFIEAPDNPLSAERIETFWKASGVGGVISKMDKADAWAVEGSLSPSDEVLLRKTLQTLAFAVISERSNVQECLIEIDVQVAHFLSHLKSSRALAAFKLIVEKAPIMAVSMMQKGSREDRDVFLGTLYDRVRVFERAKLLSRVFSPERIATLLEILEDSSTTKNYLE